VFTDGSRTYTGDQINAYKELQERKQRALHYKEERDKLGSFAFVSREHNIFSGISYETLARLIYLSTFSHITTGQLFKTQRTPLLRNMLEKVLNVSAVTAYRFWEEVKGTFITEQEDGTLWIDLSAFMRGKLGRQGSFLKVYDNAVRNLYENSSVRNARQIGYIFQMLPYLNIEHNVLCHDPYEMELKNVKLMTAKEFCAAIGYNYDNFHRLRKIYTQLCIEVDGHKERFCSFVSGGINDGQDYIFINPHVIYSGSNPNSVALLGKFSEVTEEFC